MRRGGTVAVRVRVRCSRAEYVSHEMWKLDGERLECCTCMLSMEHHVEQRDWRLLRDLDSGLLTDSVFC